MRLVALALVTLITAPLALAKPKHGKIRVHVAAETADAAGAKKANAEELSDSAEEIRKRVKKMKWIEPADDASRAEMLFVVVDRFEDDESGLALRYRLTAGDFMAEDDYGEVAVVEHAGGGVAHHDQQGGEVPIAAGIGKKDRRTYQSWNTIADGLARTLDHFAEGNYERLVALRADTGSKR